MKFGKRMAAIALSMLMVGTAGISDGFGQSELSAQIVLHTSAADYNWSSYLKQSDEWFSSSEAIAIAEDILRYQLSDGGWRKAMADTSQTGSWAKSTLDNDATTSQIRFLARISRQTGNSNYRNAMLRGIDCLLNAQYENGGWPQVFGDPNTYHAHITFNDGAMVHVLNILQEIRGKQGDFTDMDDTRVQRAAQALQKAVSCILKMQISVNGVKTAWCQQHDEYTLQPTSARAFEPAAICTSESVGIIGFLRTEYQYAASTEIAEAVNAAITWFRAMELKGIKVVSQNDDRVVVADPNASGLWARFYDLNRQVPIFGDRDGSVHYNMSEISQERRTGYSWYGNWGKNVINQTFLGEADVQPDPYEVHGTLIPVMYVCDLSNSIDWSIQQNMNVGGKIYGDRDFTYIDYPAFLSEAEYISTACDSKNSTSDLAYFTAASDLTVYLLFDTRVTTLPQWTQSWTEVSGASAASSNDVTFHVLAREFHAGETVTLGTNGMSGNCMNYTAAVLPKPEETTAAATTTTTTTTTETTAAPVVFRRGDVTCDGEVDISDVILLARYAAEDQTANLSDTGRTAAECDGVSGIGAGDVVMILRYVAQIIREFPPDIA